MDGDESWAEETDREIFARMIPPPSQAVWQKAKAGRGRAHRVLQARENQGQRGDPYQGGPHPGRDVYEALPPFLVSAPPDSLVVVAGDFNLHHPEWDTEHSGHWAMDLVLGDLRAEERLISCGFDEPLDSLCDDRPVRLTLNLAPPRAAFTPRHLFRVEPAALLSAIEPRLPPAPAVPATAAAVDEEAETLASAIQAAIMAACTGVGLRKPKKLDHMEQKVYWLITIGCCLVKPLESIFAPRLSHHG
ncbi:hypothetical protein JCM10450v2_008330 [Rhodotorula kratochvilovae]